MINLIGLCRFIKEQFPHPTQLDLIRKATVDYLGTEPTRSIQVDLVKVISAHWKRNGWSWSDHDTNTVRLDESEQIIFYHSGLAFIKNTESKASNA